MKTTIATERAKMPEGTNKVLDRRTLEADNKNLLKYLTADLHVLDVGCGSGAITAGIAAKVAKVTGIDTSENLVTQAKEHYAEIPNLEFLVADINTFNPTERYDVITAAR